MEYNVLLSKYLIERFNIVRALIDEVKSLVDLQEPLVGKGLTSKEVQYFKYLLTGMDISNKVDMDKTIEHNVVKLFKSCINEKEFLEGIHNYCSIAYSNIASHMVVINDIILKDFKEPTPADHISSKQKSILSLIDEIVEFYEAIYQFTDFFYNNALGSKESSSIINIVGESSKGLSNNFGILLTLMLDKNYIQVKLNSTENEEITYTLNEDTDNVKNFVGNPIYHLRLWWLNLSKDTLRLANERKNLIELKLQQLKLKQNNDFDPKLAKQIKFYEDELELTERKINRILGKRQPMIRQEPYETKNTDMDQSNQSALFAL